MSVSMGQVARHLAHHKASAVGSTLGFLLTDFRPRGVTIVRRDPCMVMVGVEIGIISRDLPFACGVVWCGVAAQVQI